MNVNEDKRYLTKLIVDFLRLDNNLMGLNLNEIKHYATGALEFNRVSPYQIEITGVGSIKEASEHLTKQYNCLDAMNSLVQGLSGRDAISVSREYGPEIKKGGRRSSLHIADEFIKLDKYYSAQEGKESDLTPLKLMWLVYIAHGYFLAKHGRPLIAEDVGAWSCGPVVPELYRHIKKYDKNAVTSIECVSDDECDLTATEKDHIKHYFNAFGRHNDEAKLKEKVCSKYSPWYAVDRRLTRDEDAHSSEEALSILIDDLIPEDSIEEFYKRTVT